MSTAGTVKLDMSNKERPDMTTTERRDLPADGIESLDIAATGTPKRKESLDNDRACRRKRAWEISGPKRGSSKIFWDPAIQETVSQSFV